MRKIQYILIITLFSIVYTRVSAQDAHFSQLYHNMMYYNPSFAGMAAAPRLSLCYRNQWPGMGANFVTYNAAYDFYLSVPKIGIGVVLINDRMGKDIVNNFSADVMIANYFKLSRNLMLNTGFQASYHQRSINWSGLVFPDMLNPFSGDVAENLETPIDYSKNLLDFATGLTLYNKEFHIGVAVHHINTGGGILNPKSAHFIPFRYTASAGFKVMFVKPTSRNPAEYSMSPSVLFMHQGGYNQITYGLSFLQNYLVTGFYLRQNLGTDLDALIALVGIKYYYVRMAYSYDFTLSNLRKTLTGAHEITFSYKFGNFVVKQKQKKRIIECPAF